MRVLHVYSGNLFGGVESMLVTIARERHRCAALDHEFALAFHGRLADELQRAGAVVHRLPEARLSRPLTIRRARAALSAVLAAKRFDRVVCHAAWSQAIFGRAVRRSRAPLAFWAHDVLTGRPWTERRARRVAPDLAIANSRFTARAVPRVFPRVPCVVVHPPVDAAALLGGSTRVGVRRSLETPADAVVIVTASRLDPGKGHDVLIDAVSRLRSQSWTLWIAGAPQRPAEIAYEAALRRRAHRLRITDRIRFLGARGDVAKLLGAANLHCQPNRRPDSFGIAFVEALAAGLPVVTTAIGGACEIVTDACGRLLPADDAGALARALDELVGDEMLRARLAEAGPLRARDLCDPGRQLRLLHDALAAMQVLKVSA